MLTPGRHTPGFLKLFMCGCLCVCLCVCLALRLLITSSMMWHDMDDVDAIRLVKQVQRLLYGNCSHYH